MDYFLALLPILTVLALMILLRWGGHKAGLAGLAAGLAVAQLGFGLNWGVLWVSQVKGVFLSLFVLAVMWPALFLYHWIDVRQGIRAVAEWLEQIIPDRGMCLILLAWALSGLLEGLAGFGLPVAVVAPMLVALGVPPVRAVAAVAAGHSWSVTFGDMGVIFQTLVAVVKMDAVLLVPTAALLLGIACLACGLLAAAILGEMRQWPKIAALSAVMSLVQYALAAAGLIPLAAFGAGLAGMAAYIGMAKILRRKAPVSMRKISPKPAAFVAIFAYGGLAALMAVMTLWPALRDWSRSVVWQMHFPEVTTNGGFSTPAGGGQAFRPLAHPGTLILATAFAAILAAAFRGQGLSPVKTAAAATWRSAGNASLGILFMVGLSMLMDHCGMSLLLAQGLSRALGGFYPVVSTCVGILGAFATGSNNNSNVLFGMLQKNVAELLGIAPSLLIASQTAGGSLGSMLAPAKILVGCSTVGIVGQEGQVLRRTLPWGVVIGLGLGLAVWLLTKL